jgi:hypothetical protein
MPVKRRDIESYHNKFADGCWMVIDDYYGADSNAKTAPSRADVDALVAAGCLEHMGGQVAALRTRSCWLKKLRR